MWALDNETPYAVERNWTRDKQGVHRWLVSVRATFNIGLDCQLTLAEEQFPPQLRPEYRGEPAQTSLRVDSDLLARKPATDVILDSFAHAPQGRATSTVSASLRIGDIEKTIVVHGPRFYRRGIMGLTTTTPQPFVMQPIHYEHAFGGGDMTSSDFRKHRLDTRNPVGRGFAIEANSLDDQPAHTIEYPAGNPVKTGPAGFGPIASSWSPRLELAGTYDDIWEKNKKPLLANDYDERFALCAPGDQRSDNYLRGGEPVSIVNMTPDCALQFDLPKLFFAFTTRFGSREEEHRGQLTTIFIETEKRLLSMVWQTALSVPANQVEHLDETIISEKRYLR